MTTYNLHALQFGQQTLHQTRLERMLQRLHEAGANITKIVYLQTKYGTEAIITITKNSIRNTYAHNIGSNHGFITHID